MKESKDFKHNKLNDSNLNRLVKDLPLGQKKEFIDRLLHNPMIWAPNKPIEQRRRAFNNWRYENQGSPAWPTKLQVYILLANYIPNLKISDVFPDIPHEEVQPLLPTLILINNAITNHKTFNYAAN